MSADTTARDEHAASCHHVTEDRPLWLPSAQAAATGMARFVAQAQARHGRTFDSYSDLHSWSIEQAEEFWPFIWECAGVIGDAGAQAVSNVHAMPGAQWFPEA